jgi:hypothetical protein
VRKATSKKRAQAETSDGRLDSLDPDNFKYEMTAREMPSTNG